LAAFKTLRTRLARRLFPDREAFRHPPATPAQRRAAWFDFLFVDFGILRLVWKNKAWVTPRVLRMNQPYPGDIEAAAAKGIRTIITARHDPRHGGHALVAETCARLGLTYLTLPLFSRSAPFREAILDAGAALKAADYPLMIHCKSGADRAGFLSALYLIVVEGVPVREARRQLTLRHLHIRASRTGVLDSVFDTYLARYPEESKPFLDWIRDEYDPAAIDASFRAQGFADFIDRIILRHE
jgi:uncharacterized protein (TIGR01244 family)